jgi:NitT/TauT family transport system substrate-binding protein
MLRSFLIALVAFSLSSCDEGVFGPELQHVTIAVPGQTNMIFLPLSVIEQLGYFREEGLEVSIVNVASGAEARQALLDGTADVLMSNYEQSLTLRASQSTDAVAFALFGSVPGLALGVRTSQAATVKSAKDLAGKKVGISSPSSGSHNLVRYLLRKEGVAETSVTFTAVGLGETAEAALESGQVDALSSLDPAITDLQQRSTITVLADTRTLNGTIAVYGGPYTGGAFFTRRAFVEQYPETTQRLTNAAVRALRWMSTQTPEQIVAALSDKYVGGQRSLYVAMLKNSPGMFSADGRFDQAVLTRVISTVALFDTGIAGAGIDVTKTYTNSFVERVK